MSKKAGEIPKSVSPLSYFGNPHAAGIFFLRPCYNDNYFHATYNVRNSITNEGIAHRDAIIKKQDLLGCRNEYNVISDDLLLLIQKYITFMDDDVRDMNIKSAGNSILRYNVSELGLTWTYHLSLIKRNDAIMEPTTPGPPPLGEYSNWNMTSPLMEQVATRCCLLFTIIKFMGVMDEEENGNKNDKFVTYMNVANRTAFWLLHVTSQMDQKSLPPFCGAMQMKVIIQILGLTLNTYIIDATFQEKGHMGYHEMSILSAGQVNYCESIVNTYKHCIDQGDDYGWISGIMSTIKRDWCDIHIITTYIYYARYLHGMRMNDMFVIIVTVIYKILKDKNFKFNSWMYTKKILPDDIHENITWLLQETKKISGFNIDSVVNQVTDENMRHNINKGEWGTVQTQPSAKWFLEFDQKLKDSLQTAIRSVH